jgi:predicted transcriptional regulator
MSGTFTTPQPPDSEDLSADVLNHIPVEGTTLPRLIAAMERDPALIQLAVQRLTQMGLIEMAGETIRTTPFVQKARGLFKFVT